MYKKSELFQLSALSLGIITGTLSMTVKAAEEKTIKAETEVIEITGYRGSVLRSINDKKLAQTIVDSIFSEDMGKNTDQNIADALSRVTGVSIQTEDGEGTRISVRGTESSFNNISLNGVQLTSSDGSSSVDLSAFSSDVLASIQVYKTSSADHDEGALGANVVLKTPSPLSFKDDRRSVEVQHRYNEFSGKDNRKVSLSLSHKFNDSVAMLITASDETQDIRRDEINLEPEEVLADGGRYSTSDGSSNAEDIGGIAYKSVKYQMKTNTRDRQSLNAVFQFVPNDNTDIKLNVSSFKQTVESNNQEIMIQALHANSFVSGGDNYYDPTPTNHTNNDRVLDDQTKWWTYNPDTRRFDKFLNRQSFGRLNESVSNVETTNNVATLSLSHYFTDSFTMDFTVGYAGTQLELLPGSGNVLSISQRLVDNNDKWQIPSDVIIPNGYDCTSGTCQMVVTPPEYTLGTQPDGVAGTYAGAVGPFSPTDPYANTMQNITVTNRYTEDVNKSAYLDFDWDVDTFNINQIEFGGKWSKRRKDYTSQWFQVNHANTTHYDTSVVDENGNYKELILRDGWNEVSLTPVSNIAKEVPFTPDGYMKGLVGTDPQYSSDFLNGWYLIDLQKAAENLYTEDVNFSDLLWEPKTSTQADVEQETSAVYAKANFAFLDGRLTGDIGLRYVDTKVDVLRDQTTVTYQSSPNVWTWHELNNGGLFDNGNSPCSTFQPSTTVNNTYQKVRVDQGPIGDQFIWEDNFDGQKQTVYRYDEFGNPLVLPDKTFIDGGVVYSETVRGGIDDVQAGDMVEAQYSIDPNSSLKCYDSTFSGLENAWTSQSQPLERPDQYSDLSTTTGSGRNIRPYEASLSNSYTNLLPSLNLNYIFTNDLIGRLAVSKTMARPKFEDVRAGFRFNESEQSDQNKLNGASDPNLMPLESSNLDLSLEWYFNKTSQISLAYFRKDIDNYVDTVNTTVYVADLRHETDIETLSVGDFVIPIPAGEENKPDSEKLRPGTTLDEAGIASGDARMCHPDRITNLTWDNKSEWVNRCATVNLNYKTNGASAKIEGIEFTYRQTYDFLPGPLSGLGSNINYTYAKSESKAGTFELTGEDNIRTAPQTFTPKHTLNTSLYWEKYGHSVRLTHRYNSIQYVGTSFTNYREWEDSKENLDLAINYKINKNLTVRFDGLNLTDTKVRRFLTAEGALLGQVNPDNSVSLSPYYENNPMEDSSVDTGLTRFEYRTGRHYRVSLRLNF